MVAEEAARAQRRLLSRSAEATEALGERLGALLRDLDGLVVALDGELGAGKTCLTRGLARSRGVLEGVSSPSYTLMHEYEGSSPVYHLDAWMEGRGKAFLADGGSEWLFEGGLAVVEWASRVSEWLPGERLDVRLAHLSGAGPDARELLLRARGDGVVARAIEAALGALELPEGVEEAP